VAAAHDIVKSSPKTYHQARAIDLEPVKIASLGSLIGEDD
jgi:hypothetical protein